ncbi:endolytic transglycosylase MltG, partial [Myxococcota bacterium]|nr:endolytic transglycosylase MltG [Myxococcota bacterium]
VLPEMPTVEELVELPEIAFADELVLLSDDATLVEASPVESDSLAPAVPASFLASPYSEEHVEESLPIISEPVSEPAVSTAQEEINYDEWVLTSQGLVQRSERSFPWIRLLASSFVAMAALFLMVLWPMSPKTMSSEEIHLLHIKPGATIHQIAGRLEESSLIRNTRAFSLLARVFGVDRSLKAGVYRISSGAWLWDVVGELHKGQVETLAVTLPEGLNVKEVAERLEQSGLIEADAIIKAASDPKLLSRFGISASSVEGFLFPETYTFAKGLKADEILEVMLDEFFARLNQIQGDHPARGDALRNMVTLASIVQREAKADIEMPKVAGVFQNRIQNHLRLESCATVQYILGENKLRLTLQDVRTESPYNTYLKEGLPPGPIANPGMAALKAAANPGSHEYLFFFAKSDGSGRHIFSHNYKEHQRLQKRFRHN